MAIANNQIIRVYKGTQFFVDFSSKKISLQPIPLRESLFLLDPKKNKTNYFVLHMTDACNLKCSYCFERLNSHFRKLSFENITQLADFINVSPTVDDCITIRFFGGEPLLDMALIEKTIDYFEKKIIKKIYYNIFSNGTIANDRLYSILDRDRILFLVSLDGLPEYNTNRVSKTNVPSHPLVVKNLKHLPPEIKKKTVIRAVIIGGDEPYPLVDNINFFHSLGIFRISFTLEWGNTGCWEDSFLDGMFNSIDLYFLELKHRVQLGDFSYLGVHPFLFFFSFFLTDDKKIDVRSCGAGKELLALGTDGCIYPCHYFTYNKSFNLGKLDNSNDYRTNFIGNLTCESMIECNQCDIKYLCIFRCYGDFHIKIKQHELKLMNPKKCDIYRYIFDSACNFLFWLDDHSDLKRMVQLVITSKNVQEYI